MTHIAPGWLADPAIVRLMRALAAGGATPRFVGGCVRNAVLGAGEDTDIDIAIDVDPAETTRLLKSARLHAVPTGFEHGTVTAVVDRRGFEVTSLRRDVETDGRRAVVAFTDDWREDAQRRDFTMNALYAGLDGAVLDPTGEGLADLAAGRVRFIGRAQDRIREDYLRILRFFRFHAWFGRGPLDAAGLAACAALADGMDHLARERVGAEMRKLLAAPDPRAALSAMADAGVLTRVIPDADPALLTALIDVEARCAAAPDWPRRLAALDGADLFDRLRLSKAEDREIGAILAAAAEEYPALAAHDHGAGAAMSGALLRAARRGETPDMTALQDAIARGAAAKFPLRAADLITRGARPGPELGRVLKQAETLWRDSGFALDREALLTALEESA